MDTPSLLGRKRILRATSSSISRPISRRRLISTTHAVRLAWSSKSIWTPSPPLPFPAFFLNEAEKAQKRPEVRKDEILEGKPHQRIPSVETVERSEREGIFVNGVLDRFHVFQVENGIVVLDPVAGFAKVSTSVVLPILRRPRQVTSDAVLLRVKAVNLSMSSSRPKNMLHSPLHAVRPGKAKCPHATWNGATIIAPKLKNRK